MSLLDPDLILEKARQLARSDDFLGDAWEPAFRALLAAVDAEARIHPSRAERFAGEMVQCLVTRTRIAHALRARPEIADAPAPAPVVITGLPRSGTTLLHNLMARVPGNRAYRLWELRAPVFAPGAPADQARRERDAAVEVVEWLYGRAPAFRAIHPLSADAPDECNWLFRPTFSSMVFAWTNFVPAYDAWLARSDRVPAYRDWLLQWKLLRWRSPGGVPVMKDPGHLWSLDALFEVCPDARVVVLSRDPAETTASLASLCFTLQSMDSDARDKAAVGTYVRSMVRRGREALARARARSPAHFLDVDYRRLVADPVAVVGEIQASLGRPLDPEGAARCRRFLADQRRDEAPAHRYTLEEFGLRREDCCDAPAFPGRSESRVVH
jgi:hypothetical protein